ncbi:hypothetical protein [Dasychira pudibunda nucleopolyhedrovirus]|nr:hypothetical protein [Dasychira pudibunda nucleopolyhedrovirus]WHM28328.1 hypothetical protein [Dasychira pudibunda nucleopolyhedrovirus]
MPRDTKPYSRPANAPRPGVKTERSNQFKAASTKYGKRVNDADKETRPVAFVDIKLNHRATPEMEQRMQAVYARQKPSIFNESAVAEFIKNRTFVVAFAHPTYTIQFNKIPAVDQLRVYCSNINKDLLFKDKNQQMRNALPNAASFRVQINDEPLFKVQTVVYDKESAQLVLTIRFLPRQTMELLPMKKCVVYLNILSNASVDWAVPADLLRAFAKLALAPPIPAPQNV